MKNLPRLFAAVAVMLTWSIAVCSGDGGGGCRSGGSKSTKTAIVLKTTLQDGYSDQIGSINLTAEVPTGVTVPADSSGWIPQSALYLTGQGATFAALPNTTAILIGKYFPATLKSKAKVSIAFTGTVNSGGRATGMNPGEFATLIFAVAPGTTFDSSTSVPLSGVDIANSRGVLPHLSDTTPPLARITFRIIK
jgi:hypothetical protein